MSWNQDFEDVRFGGTVNVATELKIPNSTSKLGRVTAPSAGFTVSLRSTDLSAETTVTLKYGADKADKATFSPAKDSTDTDITFTVSGDGVTVTKTFYLNRYDYFYLEITSGSTGSIEYKINVN